MDFEPITTQEKLDELLAAERAKFDGYVSPDSINDYEGRIKNLNSKIAKLESTNVELDRANKAHELNALKNKIARESGLRAELADRLAGEDENAIRADAKALAELMKPSDPAPLRSTESSADKLTAAMQRGAAAMFGSENE